MENAFHRQHGTNPECLRTRQKQKKQIVVWRRKDIWGWGRSPPTNRNTHRYLNLKHCQRHNGPDGWVYLTKVTSWGHITSSSLIRVLKIKSTTWYTSRKATKWASQSVSRVMLKPLPSSRQKKTFLHSSKGGAAHDEKKSPFYMQNREFNGLYQLKKGYTIIFQSRKLLRHHQAVGIIHSHQVY